MTYFLFIRIFFCFFFYLSSFFCFGYRTSVGLLIDELQGEMDREVYKSTEEQVSVVSTPSGALIIADSQALGAVLVPTSLQESEESVVSAETTDFKETKKKDWLFLVYIAGQNNLHKFVKLNLKNMAEVGSSQNMHVVCQIDELGKNEVTRVQVLKKKILTLEEHEPTQEYISGTAESLYDSIAWAVEHFPSHKICLIPWGHGSGAVDPHMWDRNWFFDRDSEVFNFNENTGLLELRQSIKATSLSDDCDEESVEKGIAFNEEHAVYLTNSDLTDVLSQIQENILNGEKIDIVAFDACLMGMVEVAVQIEESVKYMVASEEIVPGHGFPYDALLAPFVDRTMSAEEFAVYMTKCYAKEYKDIFADFTLSALSMKLITDLRMALNDCASSLLQLLDSEYGEEIFEMLFAVRASRKMTTSFYNRDYIDLLHTLSSIKEKVGRFKKLDDIADEVIFLQKSIEQVQDLMYKIVISNVHGVNQTFASGISVYWPKKSVHSSYKNLLFSKGTQWKTLLQTYVTQSK
jgi:hypothetical protein